eukprot:scaffold2914_cov178-Amphora_coffeaeformis.AAC.9
MMNHSFRLLWTTLLVAIVLLPVKQVQALHSRLVLGASGASMRASSVSLHSTANLPSSQSKVDYNFSWTEELAVDWDWKKLADDVFRDDKRPVVLFDGVCNLCNSGVNFAMDQDENAKLRFCSLQSRVAQSLLIREGKPPNHGQIGFITESRGYFSSHAVSQICMKLDSRPLQWFGALGQHTPPWIRESVYQLVSQNRFSFGEADQCRLDFDGTYTSRFVSDPLDEGHNNKYTM